VTRRFLEVPTAEGTVTFTIEGLDRAAWADLVHGHPSEDLRWRWDQEALNPALVQACVTDPLLSLEVAAQLVDDPDVGEDLVATCMELTLPGSLSWARRRIQSDARLAAEVAAAVRMGISHHEFTTWPSRSQDLALAHLELAQEVCPGCGVPEADMRDPGAWEVDGRFCFHCLELSRAAESIPDDQRPGNHIRLIRPVG
jgi:hypothetical protein